MKRLTRIALGLGFLVLAGLVVKILIETKPEADLKAPDLEARTVVEVVEVNYGSRSIKLPSQGMVDARKRVVVAAEVGGKVIDVDDQFKAGESFKEGEPILFLDDTDYQAASKSAELTLAEAKLALETELAKQEQAIKDWKSLGKTGEPGRLTRRVPQVESAEAAIAAAEAAVKKANADVERTKIRAPFDGVIARAEVEMGAFLAPGSPAFEIYSAAPWEIRLPLSLEDYSYLLREGNKPRGAVAFSTNAGVKQANWEGKIIRTEGEIDRRSRSIYVVAEMPPQSGDSILQPGLFARAKISGQTLPSIASIPFRCFTDQSDEVFALTDVEEDEEGNRIGRVVKRKVTVKRREGAEVLITDGLEPGDLVVWTQLPEMAIEQDPTELGGDSEDDASRRGDTIVRIGKTVEWPIQSPESPPVGDLSATKD